MRTYTLKSGPSGNGSGVGTSEPAGGPPSHEYPKAAAQPLGSKERQALGTLASQAWAANPDLLPRYQTTGISKSAAADAWRHEQVALATAGHPAGQVSGISEATRAHYKDIESHFARLAGQTPRDFNAAMQTGTDALGQLRADSRQAEWSLKTLRAEAAASGLHPNYILAIAGKKFPGATVLNNKQIWQLIYTLRNRINAKQGKGDSANRNKSQRRPARRDTTPEPDTAASREASPYVSPAPPRERIFTITDES